MRKFGLLLALIVSFGLQAQKVTRFSSFDAFSEEFDKLVSVPKELDGVFKDSLVPNFLAAVDFEKEELWLDYANQLLRKRLDTRKRGSRYYVPSFMWQKTRNSIVLVHSSSIFMGFRKRILRAGSVRTKISSTGIL